MKKYLFTFILLLVCIFSEAQTSQDKAKAFYQEAVSAFDSRNYKKTLDYCQQVEKELQNTNARIELLKIKSYYELDQIANAQESLKTFLALDSDAILKEDALRYLVKIDEKDKQIKQKKLEAERQAEKNRLEEKRIAEEERLSELKLLEEKTKREATLTGSWIGTYYTLHHRSGKTFETLKSRFTLVEENNILKVHGGMSPDNWMPASFISDDENFKIYRGNYDMILNTGRKIKYTTEYIYNKRSKTLEYSFTGKRYDSYYGTLTRFY